LTIERGALRTALDNPMFIDTHMPPNLKVALDGSKLTKSAKKISDTVSHLSRQEAIANQMSSKSAAVRPQSSQLLGKPSEKFAVDRMISLSPGIQKVAS